VRQAFKKGSGAICPEIYLLGGVKLHPAQALEGRYAAKESIIACKFKKYMVRVWATSDHCFPWVLHPHSLKRVLYSFPMHSLMSDLWCPNRSANADTLVSVKRGMAKD
jgi:hypothetical protein